MVLGQRGGRAPQGKLASNLSITDLSCTAWADMRWEKPLYGQLDVITHSHGHLSSNRADKSAESRCSSGYVQELFSGYGAET